MLLAQLLDLFIHECWNHRSRDSRFRLRQRGDFTKHAGESWRPRRVRRAAGAGRPGDRAAFAPTHSPAGRPATRSRRRCPAAISPFKSAAVSITAASSACSSPPNRWRSSSGDFLQRLDKPSREFPLERRAGRLVKEPLGEPHRGLNQLGMERLQGLGPLSFQLLRRLLATLIRVAFSPPP